jgi:hypothetical protein
MPSLPQGGGPSGLSKAAMVIGSVKESSADSGDMQDKGRASAEIVMDLKFVMVDLLSGSPDLARALAGCLMAQVRVNLAVPC